MNIELLLLKLTLDSRLGDGESTKRNVDKVPGRPKILNVRIYNFIDNLFSIYYARVCVSLINKPKIRFSYNLPTLINSILA